MPENLKIKLTEQEVRPPKSIRSLNSVDSGITQITQGLIRRELGGKEGKRIIMDTKKTKREEKREEMIIGTHISPDHIRCELEECERVLRRDVNTTMPPDWLTEEKRQALLLDGLSLVFIPGSEVSSVGKTFKQARDEYRQENPGLGRYEIMNEEERNDHKIIRDLSDEVYQMLEDAWNAEDSPHPKKDRWIFVPTYPKPDLDHLPPDIGINRKMGLEQHDLFNKSYTDILDLINRYEDGILEEYGFSNDRGSNASIVFLTLHDLNYILNRFGGGETKSNELTGEFVNNNYTTLAGGSSEHGGASHAEKVSIYERSLNMTFRLVIEISDENYLLPSTQSSPTPILS